MADGNKLFLDFAAGFPGSLHDVPDEIDFNKELSAARVSIECAFGILKSRWRILAKSLDSHIDFAIKNSIACAVLHNFCIMNGDEWDEWDDGVDDDDDGDGDDDDNNKIMNNGDDIREALKEYLATL